MAATDFDPSKIPSSFLDKLPANPPPNGVKSNFVNPESRDNDSRIVIYVMLPLMGIALLLRLYTRARVQRALGADDCLAIVSALCLGTYCGVLLYLVDGPGGEHIWDIPISHITEAIMKCNLASQALYALASIFIKSTLLVLYLRIFRPSQRGSGMIWAGIAFVLVAHIAIAIAQIKILFPKPGKTWWSPVTSGVQDAATTVVAVQGVISVVTDFYVLAIPLHLVVGLHLPFGRKLGVCAIFATGLIACICSLVGTVYRFRLRSTTDMFWDSIPAYTLTIIELSFGIICACMPILPVLFKSVAKTESYISVVRYFRTRSRSKGSTEEKDSKTEESENIGDRRMRINLTFPKPAMTGMRSFIRGGNERGRSQGMGGADGSFMALDSVNDDDYHAQLRASV